MSDLKIQHLLTLSFLLSMGARDGFVRVTTASIGRKINRSQQAASKHLAELERGGFVERIKRARGASVRITPEGYSQLVRISQMLQSGLGAPPARVRLEGSLISGMGEGAYYMSREGYRKQFREKISYVPFPGTLNVLLKGQESTEAVLRLDALKGTVISGFRDSSRTYGWVKCFEATLNGTTPCHLIRLERTHHEPYVVELISREHIRKATGLKDGSDVVISVAVDG